MKYFLYLSAVSFFLLAGCSTTIFTDTRDPDQLRERAKNLTARAAGARRTAQKYDALIEKTKEDIRMREKRLESHETRKQKLDSRINKLEQKKRELSETKADKMQWTIDNYVGERDAVSAIIDENKIYIRRMNDRLAEQKRLKKRRLQKSSDLLDQARQMRQRANKLSASRDSS